MSFDNSDQQINPENLVTDMFEHLSPGLKTGEHRLQVAILERSVLDLMSSDQRVARVAEEWFNEELVEDPDIHSFQFIAASLDLDYRLLKDGIFNYIYNQKNSE